jgi:hypothetical protein
MAACVATKGLAAAEGLTADGLAFRTTGVGRILILTSGAGLALAAGLTLAARGVISAAGFASMVSLAAVGSFVFAVGLTSTGGWIGAAGLALGNGSGFNGGLVSGADFAATVLVLAFGLTSAVFVSFAGLTSTAGALALTLGAGLRTRFTGAFLGAGVGSVFGDLALAVFARGSDGFEMARRESGFAAMIFFGFFITTILAAGWRAFVGGE